VPFDDAQREELPTILVVDDDEVSLAIICMMLEAEGYSVVQAAGGEQALKKAAEAREGSEPSIVLADLQMPGLCGRELALAMRTLLPRAMLVAMSASPGAVEEYDGFVGKPLNSAALRALIVQIDGNTAEPEAFQPDERNMPVLDERMYRKLQRMMPAAALADIYRVCLSDARHRAAEMRKLAGQDADTLGTVRRSAHAIKGGAGMVGATMLANAAARLELASYRRDDLPGLINKLLDCCDQLQSILLTKAKAC
jgi:CheY-like chemotaxis protein/HPt (histidine-containing phosphotransfer) domain-containing protein